MPLESRAARRRIGRIASLVFIGLCWSAIPAWPQTGSESRPPLRGDWRNADAWKQLRLGMSPAEVVSLLGEPGKVTSYYAFERWEYPDALGRRINFDERGRLSAWGPFAR